MVNVKFICLKKDKKLINKFRKTLLFNCCINHITAEPITVYIRTVTDWEQIESELQRLNKSTRHGLDWVGAGGGFYVYHLYLKPEGVPNKVQEEFADFYVFSIRKK